ncbi:MAG TPA: DegT/DnrJ/EryC1/StrS family aminotransferase [Candidatus Hydrogenedentes bacterium]|nr:DegT/DnrJ/EryC1/StrS family aminotransferase [Candidatus Hydrogenedentota bacterium]HPG68004.1 DegT/DnrJ/EryC1/StrS family aminotransferase [Candidatus Hydrogenedentota bacterium]
MGELLAIKGGTRTIPEGAIQPWPPIDETDKRMILDSLDAHKLVFGDHYAAVEQEFAAWNGHQYVCFTNSGTSALHMCVAACGCGVGDEVIVPAWSWPSSVTCVIHNDAIPVFVDIDFDTINIDVNKIEAAITPRTKAILVVHLHGLCVAMDRVMEVAERHHLKVIEDCCQGHGATYQGVRAGRWGHCAGFSCNQNKLLCAGEAGFFCTDDEEMFTRGKALGLFGETRDPVEAVEYHAYAMGWKYNSCDVVAAFARAQLAKLNGYLDAIQENTAALIGELADVPHVILPVVPEGHYHNWYNYTLRFDMASMGRAPDDVEFRNRLLEAINAEGVPNGAWQRFILPAMTVFRAKNAYGKGYPWAAPDVAAVDYSPAQYPVAQRHCDTHTCIVAALRPPNGPETARLLGHGIRKVMENVDQL